MATIIFSHANGFPAGTYRVLFEQLEAAGHEVRAIDKFGHDPRYPVTSNWPHLRDQLVHFIEAQAAGPVYLVGHSLGGFLSLLAALHRPDLALGVVMLDSPIIYGLKAHGVRVAKATGLIRRVSPGKISRQRRTTWTSAEEAFAHFAAKPNFARWDPQVLRDYIAAGTHASDDGQRLSFRREVETAIYNSLPHHITSLIRRRGLPCPLAFVGGTRSAEVRQVGLRATEQLTGGRISWIEGSHLYPFERPAETVAHVLRWLDAFQAQSDAHEPRAA